jgi:glutathione synthase/RimK-type ligase-like ATP-grasp enzyme
MFYIYPYNPSSMTIKSLKQIFLQAKSIKMVGSNFKGSSSKKVINWGSSTSNPEVEKCQLLNHPDVVSFASNKLNFFKEVSGKVSAPEFTTDPQEAAEWLKGTGSVVCREKLTGHSGQGIILIDDEEVFSEYNHDKCKLYTRYIKKIDEFRVHMFCGKPILVQRKAISSRYPSHAVDTKIRTHSNGYIFAQNEDQSLYPKGLIDIAAEVISLLGLDFGAVDIIYNKYHDKLYVLEVNTAPGLCNSTLLTYAHAISEKFNEPLDKGVDLSVNPTPGPFESDSTETNPTPTQPSWANHSPSWANHSWG